MSISSTPYRGRFAPTPSGALHIGSLFTAVASYIDAHQHNGEWLVRIEDIDPPRVIYGASDNILRTLEAFGLYWDSQVVYQSQRHQYYIDALEQIASKTYPCICSRKDIQQAYARHGVNGYIYPRTCRYQPPSNTKHYAIRLKTDSQYITFNDLIIGQYQQNLAQDSGDFVLKRADNVWSYLMATTVDDQLQNITHIVRGQDLLSLTPSQIYLQQLLNAPTPQYAHLPLLTNKQHQKWSKQTHATPLDLCYKEDLLRQTLAYFRLPEKIPDGNCSELLSWAVQNLTITSLPKDNIITEK